MLRVLQVSSDKGVLMRFKVKVKAVEDEDVVQKVRKAKAAKHNPLVFTVFTFLVNSHFKVIH